MSKPKVVYRWYGDQVSQTVVNAAADGVFEATESLLEEANRTVPHDEGTLMRSGVASVDREKLEGAVSYDTPYAIRQHEELGYQHPGDRRAKWLELTIEEERKRLQKHIADRIRAAIGG